MYSCSGRKEKLFLEILLMVQHTCQIYWTNSTGYLIETLSNGLVINIRNREVRQQLYRVNIVCSFRCFRILNKSFISVYDSNMNQLKKFQSFKQRLQLGKYKFHIVQQWRAICETKRALTSSSNNNKSLNSNILV